VAGSAGGSEVDQTTNRGQRRASFQRARSTRTKESLVTAATALWRTNGYGATTVADICRAAGVSKALFYFYFPRKEDLLFEMGLLSTDAAHAAARKLLERADYEIASVVTAVLAGLEETMRRNPPEVAIEAILEGYRQMLSGHRHLQQTSVIFAELLERAQRDGKLPAGVDVAHVSAVAQSLVSEGARRWAAGAYGKESFTDVVGRDICALITGYSVEAG
jgi:AcrR family transcriptional regulator